MKASRGSAQLQDMSFLDYMTDNSIFNLIPSTKGQVLIASSKVLSGNIFL